MATQYMYYPGCSMDGTGKAYHDSIEAVLPELEIGLAELDDWNCCGATAYVAINERRSFVLSARNLALAEKQGHDLVTVCNGAVFLSTHQFASFSTLISSTSNSRVALGPISCPAPRSTLS